MKPALTSIVDDVIARLETDLPPWRKGWKSGSLLAPMRADGEPFSGANAMILAMAGDARGYASNRWLTFNQAKAAGGHVRRDERGVPAMLYKPFKSANDNDDGGDDPSPKRRAYQSTYTVFNAAQIEGLSDDFYKGPAAPSWSGSDIPSELANYPARVIFGLYEPAYYPDEDLIRLPSAGDFLTYGDFVTTWAHEVIHHTGHATRLDRRTIADYHKDHEQRAREELIAELGSCLLAMRCGLPYSQTLVDSHAAYVKSWAKHLRQDPNALFTAAAAAQKAVDYVLAVAGQRRDQKVAA